MVVNFRKKSGYGDLDTTTDAQEIIDTPHHEIHEGGSFHVSFTNTTAATDDHRSAIGFSTPAGTKWLHMTAMVSATDPAEIFFIEGQTIDDDAGNELTAIDRNRNTDNTSVILSLEGTPVAGDVTTYLEAEIAGASYSGGTTLQYLPIAIATGIGNQAVGGSRRSEQEWVLAPSTKYILVVQNIGANANTHTLDLNWYEHTNKT